MVWYNEFIKVRESDEMKATIKEDKMVATLSYDDYLGERITRQFIGWPGQYVYEILPNGSTSQICEKFHVNGPTMKCRGSLIETIRKEWRRLSVEKRNEK